MADPRDRTYPELMESGPRDGRDGPAAGALALIGLFDAGVAVELALAGAWPAVAFAAAFGVTAGTAAWLVGRSAPVPELDG
jgi:hypothetical protein